MQRKGTARMPLTATVPSPAKVRSVSGNESAMRTNQLPENMARNQNIDRQPMLDPREAPMTGPILGAVFVLVFSAAHRSNLKRR